MHVKVVICGKYKTLNKITKKKLTYLPEIFFIVYSLQCKIEGHAVFKKVFEYGNIKGTYCAQKSKEIALLIKMCSTLEIR